MKDLTFIIPIKCDNAARIENLTAILKYYYKILPESKFILIEDDATQHIDESVLKTIPGITYYFLENKDLPHRKMTAINYGVKQSTTKYICLLDVDCIVGKESIIECINQLETNKFDGAWPYSGCYVRLRDNASKEFRNNLSFEYLTNLFNPEHDKMGTETPFYRVAGSSNPPIVYAGVIFFNKEKFISYGGGNENFAGWGLEDDEMLYRTVFFGCRYYRCTSKTSIIFHLTHPDATKIHYNDNTKEYRRIVDARMKGTLREYVKNGNFYK